MRIETRVPREIWVGTSGWFYDWNKDKTLDWYILNSKMNTVELNMSFYRFPFPNMIKSWSKKGKNIRFSIKVHRRITHLSRFNETAFDYWQRFSELFLPMDNIIDFYLFQCPPSFKPDSIDRLNKFFERFKKREKFALEFRHKDWFDEKYVKWARNLGITLVSVSAPGLPENILKSTGNIYFRFHGRNSWYNYDYSKKELAEIAQNIVKTKPERIYAYFNNDYMFENAKKFKEIILKKETADE